MAPVMTLVCFALEEEATPFRQFAAAHPQIEILLTGVGKKNSERSLRAALAPPSPVADRSSQSPKLILTCGFAGALDPALVLGDVIFSADDDSGLQPRLLAVGAREVRFHCADRIAASAAAKQALRQATGADAVEMESEIIRRLGREHGLSTATVRVISDTATEDLPLDFNLLMTADQRLDYTKLAGALLKSPNRVPALLRLRRQTRFAAEKLAGVLAALLGADG